MSFKIPKLEYRRTAGSLFGVVGLGGVFSPDAISNALTRIDVHAPTWLPQAIFYGGVGCLLLSLVAWVSYGWEYLSRKEEDCISTVLLFQEGQLRLHNLGKQPIELWGNQLEGTEQHFVEEKRIIAPAHYYYFLPDSLKEHALRVLGSDGSRLFKFNLYVRDKNKKPWVVKCGLLIEMKNSQMNIHAQNLGISEAKIRDKKDGKIK